MAARYAVRERTLPAHLAAARPGRPTVWDVIALPSRRIAPWGVHLDPARARAHANRLNTRRE
ncbi:hypothetical protein ACOQFV_27365 [Nocardiopsis changdeensis]|uniref:Uncharacterized protein n=1 Tax=Nocardiopsis changdeensis TaxID=2831969 RepID=A0ABX8BRI9_9ACTN|nr:MULTISPECIES: hypothetical protein [Nocardiopsis]QUX22988.1 hypothetical protein KGD84_00825 [Nocardiopsis changdeensis]QYX38931.1 hypothetical protein K1J57_10275 [Nocardiopsis sp. MT53]